MWYVEFRDRIRDALADGNGFTWVQLRNQLDLPYERACPNWARRLEAEIGLERVRLAGVRGLVWRLATH